MKWFKRLLPSILAVGLAITFTLSSGNSGTYQSLVPVRTVDENSFRTMTADSIPCLRMFSISRHQAVDWGRTMCKGNFNLYAGRADSGTTDQPLYGMQIVADTTLGYWPTRLVNLVYEVSDNQPNHDVTQIYINGGVDPSGTKEVCHLWIAAKSADYNTGIYVDMNTIDDANSAALWLDVISDGGDNDTYNMLVQGGTGEFTSTCKVLKVGCPLEVSGTAEFSSTLDVQNAQQRGIATFDPGDTSAAGAGSLFVSTTAVGLTSVIMLSVDCSGANYGTPDTDGQWPWVESKSAGSGFTVRFADYSAPDSTIGIAWFIVNP